MSRPATLTVSAAAGEASIARLALQAPSRSAGAVRIQGLRWYGWLVAAVEAAQLRRTTLRTLLCGQAPQPPPLCESAASAVSASSRGDGEVSGHGSAREEEIGRAPGAGSTPASVGAAAATSKLRGGQRPGTGRLGAEAYVRAARVECRHEDLAVGQRGPVCGHGTLQALPAGVEVRIAGQAFLRTLRYELAKGRGAAGGQILTAGLPGRGGAAKARAQARAVLVVSRQDLGRPGYRVQAYPPRLGVPGPDATQWDQSEHVGNCAYRVVRQLEQVAAQGTRLFHDDTAGRLLALMQEHRDRLAAAPAQGLAPPPNRLGRHTTARVVQVGEPTAMLQDSSRRHAGENLQGLLAKREASLATPLARSDALSRHAVADDGAVIRCHCLAHGRRKRSA